MHVVTAIITTLLVCTCMHVCYIQCTVFSLLKIYMYLPLTFVEHVVDLNGFVFGALSVVDSSDI